MYHFIIFRMSTVEQTIHISVSYTRLGEAFALQEISTPPPLRWLCLVFTKCINIQFN